MNWLFYVVVGIILICCITGYKVGFLKMTFSAFSIIISILITSILTPIVTGALRNNNQVHDYFYGVVSEFIDKDKEGKKVVTDKEQEEYIKDMSIPSVLKNSLLKDNSVQSYKEKGIEKFEDYLKVTFTDIIINIISYIAVYVIVRIIILIIMKMVDAVSKMPALEKVNKNVGVVVGLVQSLLIIWVMFSIIVICANTGFGRAAVACVKENPFLEFLYDNNVLINLGMLFFK